MTKKDLIAALANVNDDAVVLFGTKEIQFFGAFATQIYTNGDEVLITNQHTRLHSSHFLITVSVPTICGSVRRKAVNVLFLSNSKNFTL